MASASAPQQTVPAEPWRILRWRSRHLAHREQLAEGVALTMLRMPAGSFLMGAPESEAHSSDNERPVHTVTLAEFLLAQTPITQAQWRAVAHWQRPALDGAEEWPETLDPDPVARFADAERFLGDQRPVVNVSGNTPAERAPARRFMVAQRSAASWPITTPRKPMEMAPRERIETRQRMWASFLPMPGACTTCTAICGNGAPIIGMPTTKERQMMAAPGLMRM